MDRFSQHNDGSRGSGNMPSDDEFYIQLYVDGIRADGTNAIERALEADPQVSLMAGSIIRNAEKIFQTVVSRMKDDEVKRAYWSKEDFLARFYPGDPLAATDDMAEVIRKNIEQDKAKIRSLRNSLIDHSSLA